MKVRNSSLSGYTGSADAALQQQPPQQPSYSDEYQAFAASRSIDYVYVPFSEESFAKLESHVSTFEGDAVLPLVIVGEDGIGKNALLSNWAENRSTSCHKGEFLFQYFAGASTRSTNLAHMLCQLETALKEHFQLREMEVPASEARLIWSLPRFLAAAAKKHSPARIVIVIDGVCALKGQQMPAGALHWMPIKLPIGVRFIVSTIQFDMGRQLQRPSASTTIGEDGEDSSTIPPAKYHRTYAELQRRKCPVLMIDPVDEHCQKKIVEAFCAMTEEPSAVGLLPLHLTEEQMGRITAVAAHPKPLYLRTLLYALQLGVEWSTHKLLDSESVIDDLLNKYLQAPDSVTLTSLILDVYASYVGEGQEGIKALGAVLSVLYASRDGLADDEVWGAAAMVLGHELPVQKRACILKALMGNTMLVRGHRSFSHVEFRQVVYTKYVSSPERLVGLHTQMARYFDRLPASHRKVECLPYHLEVAGSWIKLRNCLVDIEMFDLWWTPSHKSEFLSLWASLTTGKGPNAPEGKASIRATVRQASEDVDTELDDIQHIRPCYDIVEEYCRSLELYRDKAQPSDERLSYVVMQIADFLLEFATNGHEAAADIPQFVHPYIPNEDLSSLGVAHLSVDEDGRSVLNKPIIKEVHEDDRPVLDQPPKTNEDFPTCTTYFFHRWMWIQFPCIALANCGATYQKGMQAKSAQDGKGHSSNPAVKKSGHATASSRPQPLPGLLSDPNNQKSRSTGGGKHASKSAAQSDAQELANLVYSRSDPQMGMAARMENTHKNRQKPRLSTGGKGEKSSGSEQDQYYWQVLTQTIREDIQAYRAELDTIVRQRAAMEPKLKEVQDTEADMNLLANGLESGEDRMRALKEKEEKVLKRHVATRQLAANYRRLIQMCQRHPAHCPALIDELEIKLEQDTRLVQEINKRLRAEVYERVSYAQDIEELRKATSEMFKLQSSMLESRRRQHEVLQASNAKDQLASEYTATGAEGPGSGNRVKRTSGSGSRCSVPSRGSYSHTRLETQPWHTIKSATGISEPELFIQKYLGTDALEAQLMDLKAGAEARLVDLKLQSNNLEKELEDTRYDSLSVGGNKEARDLHAKLAVTSARLRRARELAESMESLQRNTMSGLLHVCDLLGTLEPFSQSLVEVHVLDVIRQLEFVLDSLMDEKDKSSQKASSGAAGGGLPAIGGLGDSGSVNLLGSLESHSSLDMSISRPKEVQAALQQYSSPKTKVAARLLSRHKDDDSQAPNSTVLQSTREKQDASDSGEEGDGVEDRISLKLRSAKQVKQTLRHQAKLQKAAG